MRLSGISFILSEYDIGIVQKGVNKILNAVLDNS